MLPRPKVCSKPIVEKIRKWCYAMSESNGLIRPDLPRDWQKAEAKFSLRKVVTRILAHILLPTCLLELVAIWILVPSWGVLVVGPFLVLPAISLFLLKAAGGTTTHWKSCEACFQDGKVTVRLPARDFFVFTPSETKILPDDRLEITGSGYRVLVKLRSGSRGRNVRQFASAKET